MREVGGARAVIAGTAAVVLAVGVMPLPSAAAAAPATSTTSFAYASAHGDSLGQGTKGTYVSPSTTIAAQAPFGPAPAPTPAGGFEMNVSGPTPDGWWSIRMLPPTGQSLHAGTFAGAQRFASPQNPGLDVVGRGRGCNHSFGSFTVLSMATDASGAISELDATFVQHCERLKAPPLTGEIRWNAPAPPPPKHSRRHHG